MKAFFNKIQCKFCSILWTVLGLEALVVIYLLAPPPVEPVIVIDNSFAIITGQNQMVEDGGFALYNVSVTKDLDMDLEVQLEYHGSAILGVDFNAPKKVLIKQGELSTSFKAQAINDNLNEGSETLIVKIANIKGKRFLDEFKPLDRAGTVYTLITDEAKPERSNQNTASLALSCKKSLLETVATNTCQITLSQNALEDINISLAYSGDALLGSDYRAPKVVTLKKGMAKTNFSIIVIDDFEKEGTESITIAITHIDDVAFEDIRLSQATNTIAISDENKSTHPVSLSVTAKNKVAEGDKLIYTLSLTETALSDINVVFKHSNNRHDFTAVEKITINKGEKTKTFTVDIIDDNIKETSSYIDYEITKVEQTGFEKVTIGQAVKTKIQDKPVSKTKDEQTAFISLQSSSTLIKESTKQLQLTVFSSQAVTKDVKVKLSYSGKAVLGQDYTAPKTVVIKKGTDKAQFILIPKDDNVSEALESLNVAIKSFSDSGLEDLRIAQNLKLVLKDEGIPTKQDSQTALISLACPKAISENNKPFTCTLSSSQVSPKDINVSLNYQGTAQKGTDFTAPNRAILLAGKRKSTITIKPIDDVLSEGSESLIVNVHDIKQTGLEDLRLQNDLQNINLSDEKHPTKSIQLKLSANKMVVEGKKASFTLSLSQQALKDTVVHLKHSNNTHDFTAIEKMTINKGEKTKTFTVDIIDDNIKETSSYIDYEITKVEQTGFEKVTIGQAVKTKIQDKPVSKTKDEQTAFISLQSSSTLIKESTKQLQLTMFSSQAVTKDVKVKLSYSGKATLGQDYTAPKTVLIKKGTNKAHFILVPKDDNVSEIDESLNVAIKSFSDSGLEDLRITQNLKLLLKDEAVPSKQDRQTALISLACPKAISENNKPFACTLSSSQVSPRDINVSLNYQGTAQNGTDFTAPNSTTLLAGKRKSIITITPIDDVLLEGSELLIVKVHTIKQTGLEDLRLQNDSQTISLRDEKHPTKSIQLTLSANKRVIEGEKASFTLSLSQKALKDTTVYLKHSNNSLSFTPLSKVIIAKGQSKVDFKIATKDDNIKENNESFSYAIAKVAQNGFESLTADTKEVKVKIIENKVSITPNNDTAYLNLFTNKSNLPEDNEAIIVIARLSQKAQKTLLINLAYLGQARPNIDFRASSEIVINKGQTEGYIQLQPINDNVLEGKETLSIAINKHSDAGLEDLRVSNAIKLVIVDENDSSHSKKALLSLSGPSSISEPKRSKRYTLSVNQVANTDITIDLQYTGKASAADYKQINTVTVKKGKKKAYFRINTLDDLEAEVVESFTVAIASTSGGGFEHFEYDNRAITTTITDEQDIAAEFKKHIADQVVAFNLGSTEVSEKSKPTLDKIAALLNKFSAAKLLIEGHTNAIGRAKDNLRLSKNRSLSIREYLIVKGVAENRVQAIGYGEDKPLLPYSNPKANEVNKRVEFKVVY